MKMPNETLKVMNHSLICKLFCNTVYQFLGLCGIMQELWENLRAKKTMSI